jgi:hypothetical protein
MVLLGAGEVYVSPDLRIPKVVIPPDSPDATIGVGIPEMTFDGEPFPYMTMGPWRVEFNQDEVTTLTVTIPIVLVAKAEKA